MEAVCHDSGILMWKAAENFSVWSWGTVSLWGCQFELWTVWTKNDSQLLYAYIEVKWSILNGLTKQRLKLLLPLVVQGGRLVTSPKMATRLNLPQATVKRRQAHGIVVVIFAPEKADLICCLSSSQSWSIGLSIHCLLKREGQLPTV